MKAMQFIRDWLIRWHYPVSLPEDVAQALGLNLSNLMTYEELLAFLSSPTFRPTTLVRFMPREVAEEFFEKALKKERFCRRSLFSFYFNGGWMEFALQFDDASRLRRVYLLSKEIPSDKGIEIHLF